MTLLCTGIDGQSSDGGESYSVNYRFQYNPDTWAVEFFFTDKETGQPHKDVNIKDENGYGKVMLLKAVDFSPLNVL